MLQVAGMYCWLYYLYYFIDICVKSSIALIMGICLPIGYHMRDSKQ